MQRNAARRRVGPPVTPSSASDDFERSTLGSNWTVYKGDVGIVADSDLGMLSNRGGGGIAGWTGTNLGADQFSEVTISSNAHPNALIQVFVRRRDSDSQRYGFHWQPIQGGEWVIKLDGGVGAPLLSTVPAAEGPLPGDLLRIEWVGGTIRGLHNGVEVIRVSDPTIPGGVPGIGINTSVGGIPDEDFPVAAIASWRGRSLE